MQKKHTERKKYHFEEIIEKRNKQCGNNPWNPLTHCLYPLIELLDHNRFRPSKWSDWEPPSKLTCEYMAVDVDRCCIWLQNNVNSETAREFREKLDFCEKQWRNWVSGVSKAGGYIYSPDFETWFEAHGELKKKWSILWYDIMCVQRYVHGLTWFLYDKIEEGQPGETGAKPNGPGPAGETAVDGGSETRNKPGGHSEAIRIDLTQWRKGGCRNLMQDLLEDDLRKGVTIRPQRHGKNQPKELLRSLRESHHLPHVAGAIARVKGKKSTYTLNIPYDGIKCELPRT